MPIVEGVKIVFYFNEHPPAHFHAKIAEHQALIDIELLWLTAGTLPVAKRRKGLAWTSTRQAALRKAFYAAIAREPAEPIE